jgi:diguanylate cyclase (GGDEF)-like protein
MISQENLGNVALLALDIDHFIAINDAHGHDIGDLVLVWFSGIIRTELRRHDVFARVGGEEFIVCIVNTSEDFAKSLSNRICRRVAENPFIHDGDAIPVTVSVGAVQMSRAPEQPLKHYSQIADKLLYLAKEQGRNRVVSHVS